MKPSKFDTDFLIIGSGLAGLFAAYKASKFGNVTIVTKSDYKLSSSWYAQGGIAAALGEQDSPENHFNDTIIAGRGLCDEKAVNILVNEGKEAVKELIELGMDFDKDGKQLLFGLEGGHSHRRILHASGSATGQHVVQFLIEKISSIKNVKFHFNTQAIKLIVDQGRVSGCVAIDLKNKKMLHFNSRNTILATGGYSRIYARSTNPDSAIGEGIWLAADAGVKIRDMEFIQFHPTAFYSTQGNTFLISEAVRGEGAHLLNSAGVRFMKDIHELGELAPRDIVAKSIFNEMRKSNADNVYLDMRHLDETKIRQRFANIVDKLEENGVDFKKDLIPVAPAAHYSIGGIETDSEGRTNISNLYACGECSSTGVHGANRLASNSLLECLVFAKRAVRSAVLSYSNHIEAPPLYIDKIYYDEKEQKKYKNISEQISALLNSYAGILRNGYELYSSLLELRKLKSKLNMDEYHSIISSGLINIAEMILRASIERCESRGVHQRADFPEVSDNFLGHFAFENDQLTFEEIHGDRRKINCLGETFN